MLKEHLNRRLFWEIDFDKLNVDEKKQYVIERVLERGSLSQFKALINYYGRNEVAKAVKFARSLDALNHNFCSIYFDIPKEEFRCYTWKQWLGKPYP
jgi:hypothetical protein